MPLLHARGQTSRVLMPSRVAVIVIDDLLRPSPASTVSRTLPCELCSITRRMTKPMHQALDPFKRQRTRRNSARRLHRRAKKPATLRSPGNRIPSRWIRQARPVTRARILWRRSKRRGCWSRWRRWRRRRTLRLILQPEQVAQKARRMLRLLGVLPRLVELRAQIRKLLLRLLQCILLHQQRLRHDVKRIRITSQRLLNVLLGVSVLFLQLVLIDAVGESLQHLLFLGGHESPLRLPSDVLAVGRRITLKR